ncbi:hypothetical protein AgCh_033877 [Apium graveolens]
MLPILEYIHLKDKGKSKLSGEDSGRLLFYNELDEEIQHENNTLYDDQIEESRIAGMSSDDDGIYSDDNADAYFTDQVMDDAFDTQYSSELDILPDLRPKQRRKRVIPDYYATLGGPSVNCRHCGALMWKEERVNKGVTKGTPIFSICYKKGETLLNYKFFFKIFTQDSPDLRASHKLDVAQRPGLGLLGPKLKVQGNDKSNPLAKVRQVCMQGQGGNLASKM